MAAATSMSHGRDATVRFAPAAAAGWGGPPRPPVHRLWPRHEPGGGHHHQQHHREHCRNQQRQQQQHHHHHHQGGTRPPPCAPPRSTTSFQSGKGASKSVFCGAKRQTANSAPRGQRRCLETALLPAAFRLARKASLLCEERARDSGLDLMGRSQRHGAHDRAQLHRERRWSFPSAAAAPSPPCSVATGLAPPRARLGPERHRLENNSFGFPFDYERKDIPRTRRFDWEKMLPAKQQAVASAYPKLTVILEAAVAAASEYIGEAAVVVDFHFLLQRYGSPGAILVGTETYTSAALSPPSCTCSPTPSTTRPSPRTRPASPLATSSKQRSAKLKRLHSLLLSSGRRHVFHSVVPPIPPTAH